MKLIKVGSVKDIYSDSGDNLLFDFSDRYSIFDWGEMPDTIPNKGKYLADITSAIYKYLDSTIPHHLILNYSNPKDSMISVKKYHVPQISNEFMNYDYSLYSNKPTNTLIPLEVIFRFGITSDSSINERLDDDKYLSDLEISKSEIDYENLRQFENKPIIEFSTKLENSDRYLSYSEARKISHLNNFEWNDLLMLTRKIAIKLKDLFDELGIDLVDGKLEFAFGEYINDVRQIVLVDSIGPDELRLQKNGLNLSKQLLRSYYENTDWFKEVIKAKQLAKKRNSNNWKDICLNELNATPVEAPEELIHRVSSIYKSLANSLTTKVYNLSDKKSFEIDSLLELFI